MLTLWAIVLGACLLAGTVALLGAGSFAIAYVSTHPPRKTLTQTPASFGAEFDDVRFAASDGVQLSGWFVHAPQEPPRGVVILCHGMSANREEVLPWAAPLWEKGFALLLFDFRRLGLSEGDLCTAGYREKLDLLGAVEYIASRADIGHLPIGAFGFSMGGAAAILAAAEESRIQAVATHGAFATLDRAITQRCRKHFGPFGPIVEWGTRQWGRHMRWFATPTEAVRPVQAVTRIAPRPLLLLHGGRDRIILPSEARALHEAAGHPKALRVLPRSGHRHIHRAIRQKAHSRVARFFSQALAPEKTASIHRLTQISTD